MIYTTWTTIATLINLTIVLIYNVEMDPATAATISYCILAAVLLVWSVISFDMLNYHWPTLQITLDVERRWVVLDFYRFVVEQLALDKHVRYILTTYPVVIWALAGNFDKNYNAQSPDQNGILIGRILHRKFTLFKPSQFASKQH